MDNVKLEGWEKVRAYPIFIFATTIPHKRQIFDEIVSALLPTESSYVLEFNSLSALNNWVKTTISCVTQAQQCHICY